MVVSLLEQDQQLQQLIIFLARNSDRFFRYNQFFKRGCHDDFGCGGKRQRFDDVIKKVSKCLDFGSPCPLQCPFQGYILILGMMADGRTVMLKQQHSSM